MQQRYEKFNPQGRGYQQPKKGLSGPKLPQEPKGIEGILEDVSNVVEKSKLSEEYVTTSGQ